MQARKHTRMFTLKHHQSQMHTHTRKQTHSQTHKHKHLHTFEKRPPEPLQATMHSMARPSFACTGDCVCGVCVVSEDVLVLFSL